MGTATCVLTTQEAHAALMAATHRLKYLPDQTRGERLINKSLVEKLQKMYIDASFQDSEGGRTQ